MYLDERLVDWQTFKTFIDDHNASIDWVYYKEYYWMKARHGLHQLCCVIGSEDVGYDDFIANYKNIGNPYPVDRTIITDVDGDMAAVTDDNRLMVDAKISSGGAGSISHLKPRSQSGFTDIEVGVGQEYILASYLGEGQLDEIQVETDKDKFEVILIIDGIEIYRLLLRDLKDLLRHHKHNYGMIGAQTDKKGFRHTFMKNGYFGTNWQLKVKNCDSNTKKIKAYLILYSVVDNG